MVKGGTNFRKSSQRRYQDRKAPPGKNKVLVVNVVEDMVGKGSGNSLDEVVFYTFLFRVDDNPRRVN